MSQSRFRLLVLAAYVVLIFSVSSIPGLTPPGPKFFCKDKIAHFFEYAVLGMLLFEGIGWTASRSRAATFSFLLAVGASVGALDELYQSYVPGRSMDIFDWCADVLGTASGLSVFVFTRFGRKGRWRRAGAAAPDGSDR